MIKCRLCGFTGSVYRWNSYQESLRAYGYRRILDWHQVIGNWLGKAVCPGCQKLLRGFDMRWVREA